MLAEPRRKQRLSIDPQNVNWRHGNDNVGKKLLQRMGWTDGKGIGKMEQGSADNIKLKVNYTNSGLGADSEKKPEVWVSHHDDFAALLSSLNKGKPLKEEEDQPKNKVSILETSSNVKKRVTYKFTRGKDLSMATEQQKSAIFGHRKKKEKKKEPTEVTVVETEETVIETKQFSSNNISATDYYAEKMKKWNILMAKKSNNPTEENEDNQGEETMENGTEETIEESEVPRKKKKQK